MTGREGAGRVGDQASAAEKRFQRGGGEGVRRFKQRQKVFSTSKRKKKTHTHTHIHTAQAHSTAHEHGTAKHGYYIRTYIVRYDLLRPGVFAFIIGASDAPHILLRAVLKNGRAKVA